MKRSLLLCILLLVGASEALGFIQAGTTPLTTADSQGMCGSCSPSTSPCLGARPSSGGAAGLSVSWLESPRGLVFGGTWSQSQTDGTPITQIRFDTSVPIRGICLEAWGGLLVGRRLALSVMGRYLVPTNMPFSYSLFNLSFASQQPEERPMDSTSQRWIVESGLSIVLNPCFSIEGGVRYDYQGVVGTNPPFTVMGGMLLTSLPTDDVEFSLQSWQPYFGARASVCDALRSKLNVRVIGFPRMSSIAEAGITTGVMLPILPGATVFSRRWTFRSDIWDDYFVEVSAEAQRRVGDRANVSLIGALTAVHSGPFKAPPTMNGEQSNPGETIVDRSHGAEFTADRTEYMLGGQLALAFGSPI